jgi:hypothetical protein
MTFLWAERINQNKQRLTVRVLREQMKWKSGMSVLCGCYVEICITGRCRRLFLYGNFVWKLYFEKCDLKHDVARRSLLDVYVSEKYNFLKSKTR